MKAAKPGLKNLFFKRITSITIIQKKLLKAIDNPIRNMYNSIEVMFLEIKKAEIKYMKKEGSALRISENLRHTKILPWLSVVQSVEGSYDISLGNGSPEQTRDGGFFVAPSGIQQTIVHHINPESGQMRCRWIFLDVVINDLYRLDQLYEFPVIIPAQARAEMNFLFDRLFESDHIFEDYSCYYQILNLLLRLAVPKKARSCRSVESAVNYIVSRYHTEICIEDLAREAHMSASNFYAAFRKQLGTSPMAYLNHFRLSLAAEQLIETDDTISKISNDVGVKDPLYFSKLFRKTYGVTPTVYRLEHRK